LKFFVKLRFGPNTSLMISAAEAQLRPSKCLQGPSNGDSPKRFIKRCYISIIIILRDLVVAVMYRSQGYSTVGRWSYIKTKEITV